MKPCGTYAAYMRHIRYDGKPCDECRAANTAKSAANRRERGVPERPLTRETPKGVSPTPETLAKLGRGLDFLGQIIRSETHAC